MATSPDGGAAQPVQETDAAPGGGPVIPAYVVDDDRTVLGDKPQPVYLVSDAQLADGTYHLEGRPLALPIVFDDTRGVKGGTPQAIYLVNDPFLAQDTFRPNADPLLSSDTRTVTGDRWYSLDGVAYGGSAVGETSYGNSVLAWDALDRVPGRIVQFLVRPEDVEAYLAVVLGTNPTSTNPIAAGYGWLNEFGRLVVGVPGKRVQLHDTHYATQPKAYLITIILFAEGAALLRSTFGPETAPWRTHPIPVPVYPDARIDYITTSGNQASLVPYISARQSPNAGEALRGHQVLHYRVQDYAAWADPDALATFADGFTRANGAPGNGWTDTRGTFAILNNNLVITAQPGAQMAHTYREIGASNGLYVFDFTTGPVVGHFALTFRHTSSTTFLRFSNNGTANTFVLQRYVSGAFSSTLFSGPATWAANTRYTVVIIAQNNAYLIAQNDTMLTGSLQVDASSHNVSGTGIGFGTFDSVANAAIVHRVAFYPHSLTLPDELQRGVTIPTALHSDLLQAFGAVTLTGSGNVVSVVETGQAQVRVRAHIQMPATVGRWTFVGCCLAYVDANNWLVVRLAADHDPVLGQADDEIEVMQRIAGVTVVVGKVQFPRIFLDNAQFDLDAQIVMVGGTPWVQVYLNGDYLEAYPLPIELRSATKHGFYRNASDDSGSTIPSGAIYG